MKAIAVNGSPRKAWNTDLLLREALKGAADAGAETELIQLSDLTFSGCRSCFACKKAGAEAGRVPESYIPLMGCSFSYP